jgi:serine/threonine protein kinase
VEELPDEANPLQRNILVDGSGQACLGDFGINHITTDPSIGSERIISFKPDAQRYMAPELLNISEYDPKNCNPSEANDIYSLAMTAFEVSPSYESSVVR